MYSTKATRQIAQLLIGVSGFRSSGVDLPGAVANAKDATADVANYACVIGFAACLYIT